MADKEELLGSLKNALGRLPFHLKKRRPHRWTSSKSQAATTFRLRGALRGVPAEGGRGNRLPLAGGARGKAFPTG